MSPPLGSIKTRPVSLRPPPLGSAKRCLFAAAPPPFSGNSTREIDHAQEHQKHDRPIVQQNSSSQ